MIYIKSVIIIAVWSGCIVNLIYHTRKILMREKVISGLSELTDEAIRIISNIPLKIEEILKYSDNDISCDINKILSEEPVCMDGDILVIMRAFVDCFSHPAVSSVKSRLAFLKAKIDVLNKKTYRRKEDILKMKIPVNMLLLLCFTIIII